MNICCIFFKLNRSAKWEEAVDSNSAAVGDMTQAVWFCKENHYPSRRAIWQGIALSYYWLRKVPTHSCTTSPSTRTGEVVLMGTQSCIRRTMALPNSRSTISTIWIISLFPLTPLSSWLIIIGLNGEEMNTDYVLMYQHGLGYAHSVTWP